MLFFVWFGRSGGCGVIYIGRFVKRERLGVFIVWYVNLCGIFSWLIVGMGWDAYTFR
jgi:hypothetical protein